VVLRKCGCERCYYKDTDRFEKLKKLLEKSNKYALYLDYSDIKELFYMYEDLLKKNQELEYKLKEKICFEGHSQYKALLSDLRYVLNQVLGAFEENWCIDWNFTDIREKYGFDDNYKEIDYE
jgi:hypothetical protein